jgi:lipopolysaccharide/colanic/teichoic acid biosynthesis glycosyltransferase
MVPFLAIVALLIRLDSPGPVFFRQQRMGYRRRPFTMYKFRTMRHGPADPDARTAAMTRNDDDRITKLGRVLRITGSTSCRRC